MHRNNLIFGLSIGDCHSMRCVHGAQFFLWNKQAFSCFSSTLSVKQNFMNTSVGAHRATVSWYAWFYSTPYFCSFMIHFNNIHIYTPVSSELFLPLRFPTHILYPLLIHPAPSLCPACIISYCITWQYLKENTSYETHFAVASNFLLLPALTQIKRSKTKVRMCLLVAVTSVAENFNRKTWC